MSYLPGKNFYTESSMSVLSKSHRKEEKNILLNCSSYLGQK